MHKKLSFRPILVILIIAGILIAWRLIRSNPAPASGEPETGLGADLQAVKIYTGEAGIYRVSAAQLRPYNMVELLEHSEELHLIHRGEEQPFWIEKEGRDATLLFYAQAGKSRYQRENVYLIANHSFGQAGGLSASVDEVEQPEESQGEEITLALPGGSIAAKARLEKNEVYLPQANGTERWYWTTLAAPSSIEHLVRVDYLIEEAAPGIVRVAVWSGTDSSTTPDHHLRVALNGAEIVDESWDGKGRHILEAQVPVGLLQEGENRVEISSPGDLGLLAEIYHLDFIELEFPRRAQAVEDRLAFASNGSAVPLAGFSGPVQVYDITIPGAIERVMSALSTGQAFEGKAGRAYYAIGPKGARLPERIEAAHLTPNLADASISADYLALGPSELLQPLTPLMEWHASQGLKTLAVPWEALVDQFNGGLSEPQAIQNFIRFAGSTWSTPPRFLLLVGDSTYDPLGYSGETSGNRLPAFLVETVFGGETVSDVPLVQLDDDPWPDLAIGLVPARTAEQVEVFVQKTLGYERNPVDGGLRSGIVAIADGQEESFKRDAQAFLDIFPQGVTTELFAPAAGEGGSNQIIRGFLENAHGLVAYFGHGSINMWGKDRLFSTEDVSSLKSNRRSPVVLNLTCLTGLYTHPKVESLAETLLWAPESGAVAVLAPSSLTLPTDQSFLSQPFVRAMLENPAITLGQAHLAARQAVPSDTAGTMDVMQTFMLFGDPALSLPFEPSP